jgi:2-amino-4-hydroxy-6-hydroxymethyldihydropteridine diphosphokinase
MSLIIASGTNQGKLTENLKEALTQLQKHFHLIQASRVYRSAAVDYMEQPDFLNQVMEFEIPTNSPDEVMEILLGIERSLGRARDIPKGPRIIDLDIIFWGLEKINTQHVIIPHPSWKERSFVVRPIQELPFFQTIQKCFTIPQSFNVEAYPLVPTDQG